MVTSHIQYTLFNKYLSYKIFYKKMENQSILVLNDAERKII